MLLFLSPSSFRSFEASFSLVTTHVCDGSRHHFTIVNRRSTNRRCPHLSRPIQPCCEYAELDKTATSADLSNRLDLSILLQGTMLQEVNLCRVFRASEDGFDYIKFHKKCDLECPSLVVCQSESDWIFGAYNPLGWASRDDYRSSTNAFLFCVEFPDTITRAEKIGGGEAALFDFSNTGPRFGPDALFIPLDPAKMPKKAVSVLGTHYAVLEGRKRSSIFDSQEGQMVQLKEMEVFVNRSFVEGVKQTETVARAGFGSFTKGLWAGFNKKK